MNVELTRDAERMTAAIYKSYLEKRKAGQSKADAKMFSRQDLKKEYFPNENLGDFDESLAEVFRAFPCKQYVNGIFFVSDSLIIYMENRFKDGIASAASFLAQFIP